MVDYRNECQTCGAILSEFQIHELQATKAFRKERGQQLTRITDLLEEVTRLQGVVAEERLHWQKNEAEMGRLRKLLQRWLDCGTMIEVEVTLELVETTAAELEGK